MNYDKSELDKFILYVQNFKKVRLFGSAALSLAYLACGRIDAYYEKDIAFWDIAAGVSLIASLETITYSICENNSKYSVRVEI